MLVGACAGNLRPVQTPANDRAFEFGRDSFAFVNQVLRPLERDPVTGVQKRVRNADADYFNHCFVLSRSARQLFQFARFEPGAAMAEEALYRQRVREVLAHDPSETRMLTDAERIVIPGYANLHAFSGAWEMMLKEELGSLLQSYLQRGNWRIAFPFSERHQQQTAEALLAEIVANRPPVVHVVRLSGGKINHAMLLYAAERKGGVVDFTAYDPNHSEQPVHLSFHEATHAFVFPPNDYFTGGNVSVYEIYKTALH